MKKSLLILFFSLVAVIAGASTPEGAAITFESKTHDFGTIPEDGGKVTTEFTFTNTGTAPLTIIDAKASCGCTSPVYPKKPVVPGAKGKISVSFNPKGQPSSFTKVVTVYTNDPAAKKVKLRIKGKIKK